MAYLNYLFSAPHDQVERLGGDAGVPLTPSLRVNVSHLIAYWVQAQPLGRLLGQAIDGGVILNSTLHHQLRDPCYHGPDAVRTLFTQLAEAWRQETEATPIPPDDWYRIEIEKVLRVFAHAAECGECVVSVLEPCHGLHIKRTN